MEGIFDGLTVTGHRKAGSFNSKLFTGPVIVKTENVTDTDTHGFYRERTIITVTTPWKRGPSKRKRWWQR